jgi:hypothetical protein
MSNLLFDLHLDRHGIWHWLGFMPGSDKIVVSRRGWTNRAEASLAMTRFIELLARNAV